MNTSEIFTRAAKLAWKYKVLWLFGFFVALGADYGGPGTPFIPSADSMDYSALARGDLGNIPVWVLPAIMGFGFLALIVSLVFLFIGLIARGGLIAGVQQIENEGKVTMGAAWRAGANRVWRLLGMVLTLYLPVIIALGAGLAAGAWAFFSTGGLSAGSNESISFMTATALSIMIVLACAMALYSLVAQGIEVLAERAIVIDGMPVMDSLRKAWTLFKSHLGHVIVVALILFGISLIVGLVTFFGVSIVLAPLIFGAVNAFENQGTALGVGLVGSGVLFAILVSMLVNAVMATYVSVVWTLVYRQFVTAVKPAAHLPATPHAPMPA